MSGLLERLRNMAAVRSEIREAELAKFKLEHEAAPLASKSMSALIARAAAAGELPQAPVLGTKLSARMELARENKNPVGHAEIIRICKLMLCTPPTPEEHEEFCRSIIDATQFEKGFRLFVPQSHALLTYDQYGGGFFPIGVGWGKTLVCLVIASRAYERGLRKILLHVPAQAYEQLLSTDIQWVRRRVPLAVPFIGLGKVSKARRIALAKSGKKGCYVLPYSCLSTEDSVELIDAIAPQLVILDEAHYVKNFRSARTHRVLDYVTQKKPQLVALSGTITSKSIMDYWHLIKAALNTNTPLPLSQQLAKEWSQVLDAKAQPSEAQTGAIKPLVDWARRSFPSEEFPFDVSGFRKAYRLRLNSSPGVVSTGDSEIGTSLIIRNVPVENHEKAPGWVELEKLILGVVEQWITPNGDEIDYSIHTFKWLFELTAGFYNQLLWPTPEAFAKTKGVSLDKANEMIEAGIAHHQALQIYSRELRAWLEKYARPTLDTPMLVGFDMANHGAKNVGHELYEPWAAAKDLEIVGMAERYAKPVRVCQYKIDHALSWWREMVPEGQGGILWAHNQEMVAWAFEVFKNAGVDAVHCPAGADSQILDPANANKLMVASMPAHGTGKNLQHFQHQLFLQWPRSATAAEQTLGRLHRTGQEADELFAYRIDTTEFDALNFAACLNDALYIHQSTGVRQKLIYAGYDPVPAIFPPEVLRERGFNPKMLNKEQRELMAEKFSVKQ